MDKKTIFFLLIITIIGGILRLYRLGDVPRGFHRDEAFLGYNAYSILKTGRDMSGTFMPIHFESFIYSPGGYSYFTLPFISIFGLNEFSIRFTSAFFGTLTIPLIFFLTKKLFPSHKILSIFSVGLFAITPWHINLSRTATENILVTFFIVLGVYLFLQWTSREKIFLLLGSFLCFFVTLGIYQAPRAFLPLFLPILVLIAFKKKKKYPFLLGILYFLFILLPIVLIFLNKNLSTRIQTVSIWSTQETQMIVDEQIREDGVQGVHPIISRVVHNKAIGYIETFLKNYFRHLTYDFLFTDQGLPDRYRVPHSGLFYIIMLPILLFGVFYILFHEWKKGIFLITWIGFSIVGSALTFDDVPNLQRTLIAVPAFSILMSVGFYSIFLMQHTLKKFFIVSIITFLLIFEGYRYLHHYYVQQVVHRPWYRQEGYKELVTNIAKIQSNYKQIVITNRESAPAIFFLFYTKYDPKKFQDQIKNSSFRDFDRINFSNYIFSEEQCPLKEILYKNKNNKEITDCFFEKETLYVNSGFCELPKICAKTLEIIKRSDGTSVFHILEPNEDNMQ